MRRVFARIAGARKCSGSLGIMDMDAIHSAEMAARQTPISRELVVSSSNRLPGSF
jgi:hypothetical protein